MNQGKRDLMHTITGLREIIVAKDKEIAELKALLGGDLKELPRIDLGQSVTAEEKQAIWPNEERIDVISQNGPTGEHYEQAKKDWMLVK